MKISPEVIAVLSTLEHGADHVRITCDNLERSVYLDVAGILEACGAKWNRSKKHHAHTSTWDPGMLADIIDTREPPPKNPLAFFPTPKTLASPMANHCAEVAGGVYIDGEPYKSRILEPSAGTGALVRAFIEEAVRVRDGEVDCEIVMVEKDPRRARILARDFAEPNLPLGVEVRIVCEDFAIFAAREIAEGNEFDAIIANPPFSLEGDSKAWRTHFMLMIRLLSSRGRLACILPPSFAGTSKPDLEMLTFAGACEERHDNPAGSFEGTGIRTTTFFLRGEDLRNAEEWDGDSLWVDSTEEHLKRARRTLRNEVNLELSDPPMTPVLRDTWIDILKDAAINGRECVNFEDAYLYKFHRRMVEHTRESTS